MLFFHINNGSHHHLYVNRVTHGVETSENYHLSFSSMELYVLALCFGFTAHKFTVLVHSHRSHSVVLGSRQLFSVKKH